MGVRAKFRVTGYSTSMDKRPLKGPDGQHLKDEQGGYQYESVEKRTVKLAPVYSDKPGTENKTFWDYTPSGSIELGTINPAAWQQFELEREFYVDFTPAPPAV